MRVIQGAEGLRAVLAHGGSSLLACFFADWCPHCVRYLPAFERHPGRAGVELVQVDISDENDPLWDEFEIEVVPSLLLFKGGRLAGRVDGVLGRGLKPEDIERALSAA
jgi:thioredoxin 1